MMFPERITNGTLGVRVELAPDLFPSPTGCGGCILDQSEQVGERGWSQWEPRWIPLTRRIQLVTGQVAKHRARC